MLKLNFEMASSYLINKIEKNKFNKCSITFDSITFKMNLANNLILLFIISYWQQKRSFSYIYIYV